ncbi:MAG: NADH-quinone oxidoreductase subunit C [bacterium]|nr:NADH-quinone oxidoreductase subunit C [bacterium]
MTISEPLDPVEALKTAMPNVIKDVHVYAGETTIIVDPKDVPMVARFLRDARGLIYNFLSDISAVDYWEPGGLISGRPARFGVCYHLYSMLYNRRVRLKTYVEEEEPVVTTVTTVWPAANWLEREIMDMMGIQFEGHPDPRRILMPDDWNGHPQRRDYPLGYETIQFSFNVEEILEHKPFAKEGRTTEGVE